MANIASLGTKIDSIHADLQMALQPDASEQGQKALFASTLQKTCSLYFELHHNFPQASLTDRMAQSAIENLHDLPRYIKDTTTVDIARVAIDEEIVRLRSILQTLHGSIAFGEQLSETIPVQLISYLHDVKKEISYAITNRYLQVLHLGRNFNKRVQNIIALSQLQPEAQQVVEQPRKSICQVVQDFISNTTGQIVQSIFSYILPTAISTLKEDPYGFNS